MFVLYALFGIIGSHGDKRAKPFNALRGGFYIDQVNALLRCCCQHTYGKYWCRWHYIVETTLVGKIDQDCRLVAFRRCYTDHPSVTFLLAGLNSGWPVYVLLLLFVRLFVVFLGCLRFSLGLSSQCYRFSVEPILLKTQKTQTNKPCFQQRDERFHQRSYVPEAGGCTLGTGETWDTGSEL